MFSLEPRCQGLCGSQKYTAILVFWVSCLCSAISLPWSYVMLWRMGWAMPSSLSVKAYMTLTALAGWNSGSLTSMSKRLVRSTKVPTALALPAPLMRSPSQCPGNWRASISGGRIWMLSMSEIWPRRSLPLMRGKRLFFAWRNAAINSLRNSPTG